VQNQGKPGEVVTVHSYTVNTNSIRFLVNCMDFTKKNFDKKNHQKMFAAIRDEMSRNTKGTVKHDHAITLGAYPGRDFTIEGTGDIVYNLRIYIVKNRIYHTGVIVNKNNRNSRSIAKYLDSFRLIDK
jgi:hypothetical protein